MRTLSIQYPTRRLATIAGALGLGVALVTPAASAASDGTTPATPPSVTILGPVVHYSHTHLSPATVKPNGQVCSNRIYSEIDSSQYVFYYDGHTWFRDGPGGTITGTVTTTSTRSATISGSATSRPTNWS